MKLLDRFRHMVTLDSPLRVFYHKARSIIASLIYFFPAKGMIVIGVTGTDGKTTTCNMIHAVLTRAGHTVGLISTVMLAIGEKKWINETKMTSMDPFLMNKYLSTMKKAGCDYVVLEVSSHALFYQRIWGVDIDVAAITHITSDHLDLHKTVSNYKNTKKRLFELLYHTERKIQVPKVAILNRDDTYFEEFEEIGADKRFSYGIKNNAQVFAKDIHAASNALTFTVELADESAKFHLPVAGKFNVYNALAAIAVGLSQHVTLEQCRATFETFTPVPGRMEQIKENQPFGVIVDYAHTLDALDQVLSSLRPTVKGKLYHIFGATGDRDKTKRPHMGNLSDRYADTIILTDDDPYTENRYAIIHEVREGIKNHTENKDLWIVADREQAIRMAIFLAEKDDLVLITGKGAEQVLVTNQGKIPWDDREIVKKYLRERFEENEAREKTK